MNLIKNKYIIIAIMMLFLLTTTNPIITNGLVTIASADPICSISAPSEVWGGETFKVTALVDNKTCNFANINFNGESSGDQNPYDFTAPAVTEETIMQITVYFSEIDPAIQKSADIKIKPNALEVNDQYITDASTFHVFVKDKTENPVNGVTVYAGWGETRTTGINGKTILPFSGVPPIPEGDDDKQYPLSVSKTGYGSDAAIIYVENVNIAPMAPNIGGPMIVNVGENNVYDFTFSGGIDPDYILGNGVTVRYDYKWALSDSWKSTGYVYSGGSVTESNYWDEPGAYVIMAKTVDKHGEESSVSTKTITVINTIPDAPALNGKRYYADEEAASFTATSSDPEGHNVKYEFEATGSNGGLVVHRSGWMDSGSGYTATLGLTNGVIYNVRARATDPWKNEKGDWSDWSNTIRVVKGNIAPDTPGKPSVIEKDGTIRKFSAVTTDENCDESYGGPDKLTYIFDFGDGTTAHVGPSNPGVTVESPRHDYTEQTKLIQTYNVKVKAIDEHGAESGWSKSRLVTILNNNAINAYAGMAMTVEAVKTNYVYNMVPNYAIDGNGNILVTDESYSIIANQDGTYDIEQNGQIIKQGLDSTESVQNYITSSDPTSSTNTDTPTNNNNQQPQETTQNQAPSVSINGPSTGNTGQTLSFSSSASDPDGSITRYDWYYKGSWHNNLGSSISISYPTTGTKTVKVKVYDNDDATNTATKTVTITASSSSSSSSSSPSSSTGSPSSSSGGRATLSILADDEKTQDNSNSQTITVAVRFAGSVFLSDGSEYTELINEEPNIIKNNIEENNDFSYKTIKERIIEIIKKFIENFQLNSKIISTENNPYEEKQEKNSDYSSQNQDLTDKTYLTEDKYEEIEDEEINLDLIKIIWDFGDGHKGYGANPLHVYTVSFSDTSENKDETEREIHYNIIPIEDKIIPNDIKDATNDESADVLLIKTIKYEVTMYVIYDKDDIVNKDNVDEIDLEAFEILDIDTTSVTIKEFNPNENPLLREGLISVKGLDNLLIKKDKLNLDTCMHF
jgi:hypothetical protein